MANQYIMCILYPFNSASKGELSNCKLELIKKKKCYYIFYAFYNFANKLYLKGFYLFAVNWFSMFLDSYFKHLCNVKTECV